MRRLFLQPHQERQLLLLLGDLLLITGSLFLILVLDTYWKESPITWEFSKTIAIHFIISITTVFIFYILDLYNLSQKKRSDIILLSLIASLGIVATLYSAMSYFIIFLRPGKLNLLLFMLITGVLTFFWHTSFHNLFNIKSHRLLFIGKEKIIEEIFQIINDDYSQYYKIVGHWHRHSHNLSLPSLCKFIENHDVDLIVFSVHSKVVRQISDDLLTVKFGPKNIIDAYNFYQRLTLKYPVYFLDDFWLLLNAQRGIFFPATASRMKRAFDILFVLVLLPPALPLLLISALAIKIDSAGPVLFIQERLGQNEVPFRLFKLRTMVQHAENHGPQWCIENDSRITKLGKVLRKLRLDELPQLFNVLKGEMSLVGPRPIRQHFTEMLAKEIPFYKLRLLAKPGLTGWAQINYGHAHTNEGHSQMLQYDLFYMVHQSMWLDLLILFKTIKVMVWGKGT